MSHTTSDARKRAAETVQTINGDRVETWGRPETPTVPRVARSLDDLRVGQVVACHGHGQQGIFKVTVVDDTHVEGVDLNKDLKNRNWWFGGGDSLTFFDGSLTILADPPETDYLVPRALLHRLREAIDVEVKQACVHTRGDLYGAARDLLSAVTEVDGQWEDDL